MTHYVQLRERFMMKNKIFKKFGNGMISILIIALLLTATYFVSWTITIGLIYIICLCFGIEFKLFIATGIWLILCLLSSIFGGSKRSK